MCTDICYLWTKGVLGGGKLSAIGIVKTAVGATVEELPVPEIALECEVAFMLWNLYVCIDVPFLVNPEPLSLNEVLWLIAEIDESVAFFLSPVVFDG